MTTTVIQRAEGRAVSVIRAGHSGRLVWTASSTSTDDVREALVLAGIDAAEVDDAVAEVTRALAPNASRIAVLAAGFDVVATVNDPDDYGATTRHVRRAGWCSQIVDADDAADVARWAAKLAAEGDAASRRAESARREADAINALAAKVTT